MLNSNSKQDEKITVFVNSTIANFIPAFFKNRRNDIKSALEALELCDYDTIQIVGLSMKGAGEGYGFDAICDIGLSLYQAAKDKNPHEIRKQVSKLTNYLDRVNIVYK
ncbi:MAG: Hpt domain-containing protein [Candidatus Jettenia sp.]|uniref:Hpt domain-containing protein n=1 Tax=Candidatus Jettenia caeni TaxID=247490 RepID=I3IKS5_9BACT|nr:hypothetical protein [Candidatus Jettenia sp. AMX1]MBC6929624.1 Hpt domain-containing protein [Candidatus Jettenia sp.]NUN24168.1 Hpt domain-containing protein [Candidatus Jettenia caeni]KAA0249080.1 MAG: Hpt domain-containing protein [Candidatus Jettenia sp. AMX1]MCE7881173.1 Hpt domain-containing protein [Candidatus Jettenia sp. AMX1]MCQ3927818.1 Hpt domain-containing protein [Candidatus Jettenia sp.]